jgi:hypothetical protein
MKVITHLDGVRFRAPLPLILLLLLCPISTLAQRDYTVIKPRERSPAERVVVRKVPLQPTKGTLAVVLNYDVKADVLIRDAKTGKLITQAAATDYQAEFELRRGWAYEVEVSHPSYVGGKSKTKPLGATEIVRLELTAQFATLRLRDLPESAQVYIDNQIRGTADKSGAIAVTDLKPGDHDLLIRHPQYEDYYDRLTKIEAGQELQFGRLRLSRLARLAIQGTPGARVLIDGEVRGVIKPDGSVRIGYELEQPGEHTMAFELIGYETVTRREMLKPGVQSIEVKLEPIITAAGFNDIFDSLSQWKAPPAWKIAGDARNRKLEVRGEQPGLLRDKIYRDCEINFTIWLNDGKGATWIVRADKEGRRYYMFHIAGPNTSTLNSRKFYTYLVTDGKAEEISSATQVIPELNTRTSYTINIRVQGNTIKHTITSNETGATDDLGLWTDTSLEKDRFLYGTIGFRSFAGEIFSVDDLALEPLQKTQ